MIDSGPLLGGVAVGGVAVGGVARLLLWVCGGVLLLYGVYVLYFFTGQRAMLFPRHLLPPAPAAFGAPNAVDLSVNTAAGPVEAWLLLPANATQRDAGQRDAGPYPLVIIGHGNGEIIDQWVDLVAPLRAQGIAVLLTEYPGYGRSAGAPTQKAIVDVFVQAYDAALQHAQIDPTRVLLFGRSVGGGVVAQLAARRPSAGMVLFSTFSSVGALAREYRLPAFLARDPFDTLRVVRDYAGPLVILHGEQDPIISFAHAERLHAAAPHSELRALPCGHNDCVASWADFWAEIVGPPFGLLSRTEG